MPDILKGHAIFGVAFIHSVWTLYSHYPIIALVSEYFRWGVPVFFVLWAYFLERKIASKPSRLANDYQTILGAFPAYFIPFVVWSSVYFLLVADFNGLTIAKAITKHWTGFGWSGQYFFIVLFQLLVLFPLLRRIPITWPRFSVISIFYVAFYALCTFALWQHEWISRIADRPFLYWLPYPLLGILLARMPDSPRFTARLPLWVATFIPLLMVMEMHYLPEQISTNSNPYFMVSTLITSIFVACFLRHQVIVDNNVYWQFMGFLGRHSMAIFCLNPLIPLLTWHWLREYSELVYVPVASDVLTPFVLTTFICLICIGVGWLLKRLHLGILVGAR